MKLSLERRPLLLAALSTLSFVSHFGRVRGSSEVFALTADRDSDQPDGDALSDALAKKCRDAGFDLKPFDKPNLEPLFVPRVGHPCKSATANARGQYSSHDVPCTMTFHQVQQPEGSTLKPNAMSDVCSEANELEGSDALEVYVTKWPDECVGDFPRCYTLSRDEVFLLRFLCNNRHLVVPNGTTHVRMDCTHDKMKKEDKANEKLFDFNSLFGHIRELLAVLFAVVVMCLASAAVGLRYIHRHVVAPFLPPLRRKSSKSDLELNSKVD